MRLHDVESTGPNSEDVVTSAPTAMVVGQFSAQTKRLNVVVQQSKEFVIADVLDASGDLPDPLFQPIIVHLC